MLAQERTAEAMALTRDIQKEGAEPRGDLYKMWRAKLQAVGSAFKDYALAPNQFLQINGAAADILGSGRDSLGDLRGLELDFQVISGTGAVAVFASSVDNGTGVSILRTE